MYKKTLWLLSSALLLAICVFTVMVFKDYFLDSGDEKVATAELIDDVPDIPDYNMKHQGGEPNPFDETTKKQDGLTDKNVQNYIHGMSHQKVKADDKWFCYTITDKRIEWLIDGVENSDSIEYADIYLNILKEWKKGDFSNVVEAHNIVWEMRGGKTGKAKRKLTEQEEEDYLEEDNGCSKKEQ